MKNAVKTTQKWLALVLALAMCLSLAVLPASAEEAPVPISAPIATGTFENTSGDGGGNVVNLSTPRSFKAMVPVDMTEAQALEAAKTVVWSLDRDGAREYLDAGLYPNQYQGGALDSWLCTDGTSPLFANVKSSAETADGQVYLTATFDSNPYFYVQDRNTKAWSVDPSVPHANGGAYLDVCGYFNLTAALDGAALGAAALKITPYDNFHTMAEIYAELDSMVAFAEENTGLYVEKFSMGRSQGDNGLESLDMPYLIVAKDKAAVDKWNTIKAQAESDPAALIKKINDKTLGSYQVPVLYSNVHANEVSASDGIVKFAWMLLEAAADDGELSYDKLTGFTAAGEAELQAQMGEKGAAGSVAVPDLVSDTATYLGYIKGEGLSVSGQVDLEKYYTSETQTVSVKDLLDDLFFIIVPEENVEGRTYVTRTSSGGFDLNRDNSFQTQAETRNMTALIAQWNPVSFTEFHGRVKTFQCEPCDPPHEPNFEYDLLAEHLMTGGEAFGIAAVANNDGYNSYVIPQRDYLSYTGEKTADGADQTQWYDPWDDMSTSYTPQYAMLHGTVSYTVEVPAYNDATATAVAYGQLGQSDYIAANKDSYLLAQAKIFERGVTNANSDAYELVGQWFCDQYDVEGAEAALFRPEYDGEGQNGNFYPECYIIPLDGANQKNLQAADEMLTYLTRNGVKVMTANKSFNYGGVDYPAGTAVVSMYQAKRSVANGVLYDGTVITEWPVLYSEGITAFNKTRGFDMAVCAESTAYKTIAASSSVSDKWSVESSFTGVKDAKVILSNASEASTAAVNSLLQAGKEVSVILTGDSKGSFLCDWADWLTVSGDYLITGTGVAEADAPLSLSLNKAPVVYISGKPADNDKGFVKSTLVSGAAQYNYDRQSMQLLGFTVTDDASKADLIIGAAALDEAALAAVKSGKAYIGYGSNAMRSAAGLFEEGALVRETAGDSAMDALAHVTYPTETLVNASYIAEGDDILYGYGAGYFASVPKGSQVLVQLDGSKELLEGFLPSTGGHYADFLNNSVQAIEYHGKGAAGANLNVVLFANTLTNKVHQRDEFAFISNAAFAAVVGDVATGSVKTADDAKTLAGARYTDVNANSWYAESVGQAAAQGLMNGTSKTAFSPMGSVSRQMAATILYRMAGSPDVGGMVLGEFSDGSQVASWASDAMVWAVQEGVLTGSAGALNPNGDITRQELSVLLYRMAGSPDVGGMVLGEFSDGSAVASWAHSAMVWAVQEGVLTGSAGSLAPGSTATRAELATIILRAAGALESVK